MDGGLYTKRLVNVFFPLSSLREIYGTRRGIGFYPKQQTQNTSFLIDFFHFNHRIRIDRAVNMRECVLNGRRPVINQLAG